MKKLILLSLAFFSTFCLAQEIKSINISYELLKDHKRLGWRHINLSMKNDSVCMENYVSIFSNHIIKREVINGVKYSSVEDRKATQALIKERYNYFLNELTNKNEVSIKDLKAKINQIDWEKEKENDRSHPIWDIKVEFSNGTKKYYDNRDNISSKEFLNLMQFISDFADYRLHYIIDTTPIVLYYLPKFETKECFAY